MKSKIKFYTLTFFLFCIFTNSYSQQNVNGWYWANSLPQSNTLNWVQIVDAANFYAAGANGTLMKSTDGGDNWIINTSAGVTDLSFGAGNSHNVSTGWFFNANTGIVGGASNIDDGGIIKRTTDGGMTFSSINLGLSAGLPKVNDIFFINSSTGFICGNTIVKALKTTDGGLSWNSLPNMSSFTQSFTSIHATDADNIYITGSLTGKILKTSNGGTTWVEYALPVSGVLDLTDLEFQNSSTGFVSGNPNYFAYTTNSGVSWTQTSFPNVNYGIYDLEIVGSAVYALSSLNEYYYTSDLGTSWNSVNFHDPSNANQPLNYLVYAFDFNNNDAIIVGSNGKINISNDNGSSWRNKNYSVGNNELNFPSVYAQPGTDNVWAGSDNGVILSSTNNGTNWYKFQTTADYSFQDIEMTNSTTGYAGGGFFLAGVGYCYKTIDGGATWNELTIPVTNIPVLGLTFVDSNTGWIFGGYGISFNPGLISKTTDGGIYWTSQAVTPASNSIIIDGDMFDANTGYCVGGSNVWKTINGGNNWDRINNLPEDIHYNSVKMFSGSTVYIGSTGSMFKSTNGGSSWQSVNIPANSDPIFKSDWFDTNNGTAVGVFGYTAKTSNGGITWEERNTGSSTLTGVSMSSANLVFTSSDRNVVGAIFRLNDLNTNISLNLKIGIQGFWDGNTQVGDTVLCHLRNSVAPFNEVEVSTSVLNTSGNGTFTFNSTPSGSYYIEITHRNSLETWSSSPVALTEGEIFNYDFTTSASQAYGNNIILTKGIYCNYSGDINQNGNIDLNDVVSVNNRASVFSSGYLVEDISGDNFVDLTDLIFTFNNASLFVTKITP